jgi:hypothetical protein
MDNLTVYRIEHEKSGIGPFHQSVEDIFTNILLNSNHNNFNTPQEDRLDIYLNGQKWYCAYKTINDIKERYSGILLETLNKEGFYFKKLTVSQYQIGKHQIIFTKESIIDIKILKLWDNMQKI